LSGQGALGGHRPDQCQFRPRKADSRPATATPVKVNSRPRKANSHPRDHRPNECLSYVKGEGVAADRGGGAAAAFSARRPEAGDGLRSSRNVGFWVSDVSTQKDNVQLRRPDPLADADVSDREPRRPAAGRAAGAGRAMKANSRTAYRTPVPNFVHWPAAGRAGPGRAAPSGGRRWPGGR
jgi:hypothetical protein